MRHLSTILLVLAACGGPGRHSGSLDAHEQSSANHKCGYNAIHTGQRTATGELITFWLPCWDPSKDGTLYRVPADRVMVATLARAEATQCIGLFPASLERSPFAQRDAIDEIIPHRTGTTMRGVHVVFKPIPGLTVSWMRRAIGCHQARWQALGRPAEYLAGDPTLVEGAHVEVTVADHRIAVRIETDSAIDAQLVLDRARDLIAPRVATH